MGLAGVLLRASKIETLISFHASLRSVSTFQSVFSLMHDSRTISVRYRVLMGPKEKETVGYRVFLFASFSKL